MFFQHQTGWTKTSIWIMNHCLASENDHEHSARLFMNIASTFFNIHWKLYLHFARLYFSDLVSVDLSTRPNVHNDSICSYIHKLLYKTIYTHTAHHFCKILTFWTSILYVCLNWNILRNFFCTIWTLHIFFCICIHFEPF